MKAQVFLFLAAGIALFLLGGFAMNHMVQAQVQVQPGYGPYVPYHVPMSVTFPEDPFRQHGVNVDSYYISTTGAWVTVDTIPSDKRFVVTDICAAGNTQVKLRDGVSGYNKVEVGLGGWNHWMDLNSGIVFRAGERIEAFSSGTNMTISGYYVDI